MKSKLNKRRGFTIIEVLIAVAVMAILITAVMNGINGAKKEARQKIWQTEVKKEALHAVELVEDYMSSHPTAAVADAAAAVKNNLRNDPTGNQYVLSSSTNGLGITLTPSKGVTSAGVQAVTLDLWK